MAVQNLLVGGSNYASTATSFTFGLNLTVGADTLVIVEESASVAPGAPTSMTYNGVPLTMVQGSFASEPTNGMQCSIWYMLAPPTGSLLNVVINYAQSVNHGGNIIHFALQGVDQNRPVGPAVIASNSVGNTTPALAPVLATGNDLILCGLNANYNPTVVTDPGGLQTNVRNTTSRAFCAIVSDIAAGNNYNGGIFTWTFDVASTWAATAAAFQGVIPTMFPMESNEYF